MINSVFYVLYRPEVQKQLDELDAAWTDVSKAVDDRDAALEEALDKSSKFQVRGLDGTGSKGMTMIKTMTTTMKLADLFLIATLPLPLGKTAGYLGLDVDRRGKV